MSKRMTPDPWRTRRITLDWLVETLKASARLSPTTDAEMAYLEAVDAISARLELPMSGVSEEMRERFNRRAS